MFNPTDNKSDMEIKSATINILPNIPNILCNLKGKLMAQINEMK